MRTFHLDRSTDHTGISGVGIVAEGVQFSDGAVAVRWKGEHASVGVWASIRDVDAIHGHGGATEIVWGNRPIIDPTPKDALRKAWGAAISYSVDDDGVMTPEPVPLSIREAHMAMFEKWYAIYLERGQ